MNKFDIVYANNATLGYFIDGIYKTYSKEEKKDVLNQIEKLIIKKDVSRKLTSLVIGLIMLLAALILAILLIFDKVSIGDGKWFNYTFILAGLILLWIVFYYLLGFIFYSKLTINIHFKNKKLTHQNSCVTYASSNYYKYVNNYLEYIKNTSFVVDENKKKKDLVLFGLKQPSVFKNLIFNGSINSNIPYYYLTIKNKKFLFFPGFIIIIDGKDSKIIETNEFKVVKTNKQYSLSHNDKLITSFLDNGDFNVNFFNFKYEQI